MCRSCGSSSLRLPYRPRSKLTKVNTKKSAKANQKKKLEARLSAARVAAAKQKLVKASISNPKLAKLLASLH